ncbi:MAG TPA: HNH endonuclease signature motif containing protein, partial [Gammaproteobacteria bacterium]|nr:HNH endonuclease signature motif containing protein [Gammaproteobacteria bacterium]
IVEDEDGEPLSVGRKTRSIPPALARALSSRDGGCRFPGCGRTLFTEGHHVIHWAKGGETKLSNLITLCTFHHRLLHEGGFGLRATADGGFEFTRPDGTRIEPSGDRRAREILASVSSRPGSGEPARGPSLFGINRARGIEIDHRTAAARWMGDKLDYGWAVEDLIYRRDRARRQAAH